MKKYFLLGLVAAASFCYADTPDYSLPQTFVGVRKIEETVVNDRFRVGLGYASYGNYSGGNYTGSQEIPSLSSIFDLNAVSAFQLFFGIGSINPSFNFGVGVAYRHTLIGDRALGFHAGALVNFGLLGPSDIVLKLGPILGVHFGLFHQEKLSLSIDGGPLFAYRQGVNNNFQFAPMGGLLGLSIHYFF